MILKRILIFSTLAIFCLVLNGCWWNGHQISPGQIKKHATPGQMKKQAELSPGKRIVEIG